MKLLNVVSAVSESMNDIGFAMSDVFPVQQNDPGEISLISTPAIASHPMWVFDADLLWHTDVLICALVLFISGLLCSAGGIGGGGIYVSVLMVAGRLVPHDAVPLSKAVVFFGSCASLVLNLRKKLTWPTDNSSIAGSYHGDPGARTLIDYSICRIVVPSALVGTLLGVIFNRLTADWVIIGMLCVILCFMTGMVMRTALQQYFEEGLQNEDSATNEDSAQPQPAPTQGVLGPNERAWLEAGAEEAKKKRGTLLQQDIWLSAAMLAIIITCGVLRYHASACMAELQVSAVGPHQACTHPLTSLLPITMETMIKRPNLGHAIHIILLAVPICVCFLVVVHYSKYCIANEGWTSLMVTQYMTMGIVTGILAGLVGIGGGLIFSPFFLVMGVDPRIAVATSSTCVIFTSSSTTLQYMLTDRIIISLAVVYGTVNLVASWFGTKFVHFLQDNFQTRRSFVTAIVALGVLVSLVLCIGKFCIRLTELNHSVHAGAQTQPR